MPPSKRTKVSAPEPEQTVYRICKTCEHWRPKNAWPHIGECMPTMKAMGQPLVTLDYASCEAWKWIDGDE